MLRIKGDDVFWNGTLIQCMSYQELSREERFEFLCAISPHDPGRLDASAEDDSRSSAEKIRG